MEYFSLSLWGICVAHTILRFPRNQGKLLMAQFSIKIQRTIFQYLKNIEIHLHGIHSQYKRREKDFNIPPSTASRKRIQENLQNFCLKKVNHCLV